MIDKMDFGLFKQISDQENLSEIFDYELNTFDCVRKPKVTGNISLYDLLMQIKYNFLSGMSIDDYLIPKYVDGKSNPDFTKIKEKISTVCYNATFKGYLNEDNLIAPTNLMFLDIDHFNSKDEALAYKEMIVSKYDWIVSCNLSLSRIGLHIIILVDKIIDKGDFNRKYDLISTFYFEGKLDDGANSLVRHTIIPSDINIYINGNPNVLSIDSMLRKVNAVPATNITKANSNTKEKGSGRESIREEKKKGISTAYTFLPNTDLQAITNDAARDGGLIFEEVFDESRFVDPNIPLYYPEGIGVIEINLIRFNNEKVYEGNRNKTIGGISVRLICLNTNYFKDKPDNQKKSAIMTYMLRLNRKICSPPLPEREVVNSVNSNWNRYVSGKIDVNLLLKIKKAFWSKHSTLTSNEKRSVTAKIKNEPKVTETRKKIADAIKELQYSHEKITQKKVAKAGGLSEPTVKNYWSENKSMVKEINQGLISDSMLFENK